MAKPRKQSVPTQGSLFEEDYLRRTLGDVVRVVAKVYLALYEGPVG